MRLPFQRADVRRAPEPGEVEVVRPQQQRRNATGPRCILVAAVARLLGQSLDPDVALLQIAVESASLDYKADLDIDDKRQRATIAKDVIAFADSGGGTIVVGVSEGAPGRFEPTGIAVAHAAKLEVTRLNQALRPYVGPGLSVETRTFSVEDKVYVRIAIPSIEGTLALAHQEHQDAGLFPGRVYVRTDAAQSIEVRDHVTLTNLLDRVLAQRLSVSRRAAAEHANGDLGR